MRERWEGSTPTHRAVQYVGGGTGETRESERTQKNGRDRVGAGVSGTAKKFVRDESQKKNSVYVVSP